MPSGFFALLDDVAATALAASDALPAARSVAAWLLFAVGSGSVGLAAGGVSVGIVAGARRMKVRD